MRLPNRGRAIGLALILGHQFAVEHAAECGCSTGPVHSRWRLQVNQVIVRLTHSRVLSLVPPSKEQLGTLLKEAACTQGRQGEGEIDVIMT